MYEILLIFSNFEFVLGKYFLTSCNFQSMKVVYNYLRNVRCLLKSTFHPG